MYGWTGNLLTQNVWWDGVEGGVVGVDGMPPGGEGGSYRYWNKLLTFREGDRR